MDALDEFLEKADLVRYKDKFLANGLDRADLILSLSEADMQEAGLDLGGKVRIRKAHQQHRQTDSSSHQPIIAPPIRVLDFQEYTPATPNEEWRCQKDFQTHDVFISYRVSSEADKATALHGALAANSRSEVVIHPYLDSLCLCDGNDWEKGFINGLYRSSVIVLLLSEEGLKRTLEAHNKPDNQLLEIQHALKRIKDGDIAGQPVIVQPIFMWSSVTTSDGRKALIKYFPPVSDFPKYIPIHRQSPLFDGRPMTIEQTIQELMKLQALDASDTKALKRLVPSIRNLITKTKTAADQGATYHKDSPIQFTKEQDSLLRSLLDPVDSTTDRRALEDLYVEGTRHWLFNQTTDWVNQDTADTVLWVNAVAGVGKSVAAAQIANILTATNQLVSALFLKYNDIRKSDPRVVLNTIAYGLCKWYSPIGRKLLEAGHTKDDLDKMSIPELFKAVIADPLEAIGDYRPKGSVMILVDALDECSPRDQLLSLLAVRFVELNKTRPWLKLLLTSRPEDDIKAAFDGVPTKTIEPSSEENIRDLEVFILHRLRVYDTLSDSDRTEAVAILLDQSKTFVWINLILNTVDSASKDGPVTLATIKDINDSAADVGQLYHKTFAKIHPQSNHPAELVMVVSAIATAQSILTPQIIADVFGLEIGVVCECLKSLSLVLDPGANGLDPRDSQSTNTEVKFNHKSVADYLLGDASTGHPWHVSDSFHTVFAKGCLGVILSHEPVINICDIYDFHDNIADLEDRVAAKITPSLRYSVAHWITHFVWCVGGVAESSPVWQSLEMVDVAAVLTRFVKTHVLFWLECGSLTHVVEPIIEQLAVLRGVTNMAPSTIFDDTTKELVKDTYRFIREFADPIIKSAPQVYNSGYAFTPKETAIYKTYADQLEDKIPFLVTAGPAPTWDPCVMTLTGHTYAVNSVATSLDGKCIISGSNDSTLRVWDAATGQAKHTLEGHTGSVKSVAISPDGRWITSGSRDNSIKVWDATTGQLKFTLEGHAGSVNSVAISPDGKRIASASSDKTIKVWDAASGQLKHTLEGHIWNVSSVAVAPNGEWIVSGSHDSTIKVWDATTGQVQHTLEGHKGTVNSVAISPDGQWIVSGSSDHTAKVWDATTGQARHTLEGHRDAVWSVVASPDHKWIASGCTDGSINIWDVATWQLKYTLEGQIASVYSLSISPDSRWIVSGFRDEIIKVWEIAAGKASQSLERHTGDVLSVATALEGRWIASASRDETIKIWDAITGRMKQTLVGHTHDILSVSISPDDATILSRDLGGDEIVWVRRGHEFVRSRQSSSGFIAASTPSTPSEWVEVGSASQWFRHGIHNLKVPHALHGDRKHQRPTFSGGMIIVKLFPAIILPIYLETPEVRQEMRIYFDDRAAHRAARAEAQQSPLGMLQGLLRWLR